MPDLKKLPRVERLRLKDLRYDAASGKHYVEVPITFFEKEFSTGRIATVVQEYRPDLPWDLRDQGIRLHLFGHH